MVGAVMHLGFDGKTLCGAPFLFKTTVDKPALANCKLCGFIIDELKSGRKRTLPETKQASNEENADEILYAQDFVDDFGLSAVTIRKLWKQGSIPCVKTKGGRIGMSRALYSEWRAQIRGGAGPTRFSVPSALNHGTIYFVQAEGEPASPIKIGFTAGKTTEKRLKSLQTAHPKKLGVVTTIPGTLRQEQDLHERFKAYRLQGEWFSASPELLAWIRGLQDAAI